MALLSRASEAFLAGAQFGVVLPPAPARPLPHQSARGAALERLADYIATLTFSRAGGQGEQPVAFQVPRENISEEQPDAVKEGRLPAIGFVPGEGLHESVGLGPPEPMDETFNVYAPGTALVQEGEYLEQITVEAWGSHRAERRALAAGLLVAFRPLQETTSLRLTLPDYWDAVAEFTLTTERNVDDSEVVRGRRRGLFRVDLRVPELVLVDVRTMRPYVDVVSVGTAVDEGPLLVLPPVVG